MPAEVDSMFSVRENAWHDPEGRFTLPDYPSSIEEARRLAGLEWEPEVVPAFVQRFAAVEGAELPEISYEEAPDTRLVLRTDTGDVLGHVGTGWTPVTNRTLFEFAEAVLELPNTKIATAGSLSGGRNVWALIELDEPFRFPGDDSLTLPYLSILNGHDGSSAFRALPTQIRIVCRNTYRAAELAGVKAGRAWTFRHTGSVMDRIEEAKAAIAGVKRDVAEAIEAAEGLLRLPASEEAYRSFVELLIPSPADHGDQISKRVADNIADARRSLRAVYDASPTCDAHRGSALGLVDAAFEYYDHLRGYRNRDSYLGRCLLKPEPLKAKAVQIAREVCTA